MKNWSKDSMIKAAILAGSVAVLIITMTIIKIMQGGKDNGQEDVGGTAIVTEAPTEAPTPTAVPTVEPLTEDNKNDIAEKMTYVLNIRYRGEYTEADKQYIKDNFTEDTYKIIDDFYSSMTNGSEDNGYVNVELLYKESEKKLKEEKERVESYPYDTYEEYLNTEYPAYTEEQADDTIAVNVPDWYNRIIYSYENEDIKWDGCSAKEAKENGTLDYYLDKVYPAVTGKQPENREFNFESYEKGIEIPAETTEEVPMTLEEWEKAYKEADIPEFIYTSGIVVTNKNGDHIVYNREFPASSNTMTVTLNGYDYEITKGESTGVDGWANTRGKEWYNFNATIYEYKESTIDGMQAEVKVEYMSYGVDESGNNISIDNYMDVAYTVDGKIKLYGIGVLANME